MKIKFLHSMSGPAGAIPVGHESEWEDDAEAARLCEAGIATPVIAAPEMPENTNPPETRGRKGAGK